MSYGDAARRHDLRSAEPAISISAGRIRCAASANRTLGPRDSLGNPYGGDFGISGQLEAILPMPRNFEQSARLAAFFDFGQAYYLGDTKFTDRARLPGRLPRSM